MSVILLTRPEAEAMQTKAKLEAAGHTAVLAPIMRPERVTFDMPTDDRSLIVTSKNAVHFGLRSIKDLSRPIYAVGDATADAVRDLGFANVTVGPGNVKGLIEILSEHGSVPRPYTYLRGETVSYDLTGAITAAGGNCVDAVVYRMQACPELPKPASDLLRAGEIDAALFYSVAIANLFEELVADTEDMAVLKTVDAYSMSSRIEEALLGPWRGKFHPLQPREDALLALIGKT